MVIKNLLSESEQFLLLGQEEYSNPLETELSFYNLAFRWIGGRWLKRLSTSREIAAAFSCSIPYHFLNLCQVFRQPEDEATSLDIEIAIKISIALRS